jgi:hypothetical protein
MSRTVKGSKSTGYEYWGKRALSCCSPGRDSKKITHSMERMQENKLIADELDEFDDVHSNIERQWQVLKVI